MDIEGELKNFIRLCVLIIASIFYCYYIAAKIPKGLLRLLSLLPAITLLTVFPFNLHTFHLGIFSFLYFSWLANFKLILFAFDQDPLSSLTRQDDDALYFILMACLPIKIKQNPKRSETRSNDDKIQLLKNISKIANSFIKLVAEAILLGLLLYTFNNYKQYLHNHKHILLLVYFSYTYHAIQLALAIGAIPPQILLGLEVEPQFNKPLLSTSLQDFWGHRWNLRVSDVLRTTVYTPLRSISIRIIGPRWASLPAVLMTFFISGLMHELSYYHITRETPTWEITWFFVLQGVCVDIEIVLKKKLVATNKFGLHRAISRPLTLANIAFTAGWLSYTQIVRNGIDEKIIRECSLFVEFLKGMA